MDVAAELMECATHEQHVPKDKLVLHADNGGPMKDSTMPATLHKLGVLASFSRPRVTDDNPYAEALFRTLKYRPGYPRKPFESIDAARGWVSGFVVAWYNQEYLHSAIRYVTPNTRHASPRHEPSRRSPSGRSRAYARSPRRWTGNSGNWTPIGPVALNPSNVEATFST